MSDEDKAVQVRLTMPEKYRRLFKALCTERDTDMSKENKADTDKSNENKVVSDESKEEKIKRALQDREMPLIGTTILDEEGFDLIIEYLNNLRK